MGRRGLLLTTDCIIIAFIVVFGPGEDAEDFAGLDLDALDARVVLQGDEDVQDAVGLAATFSWLPSAGTINIPESKSRPGFVRSSFLKARRDGLTRGRPRIYLLEKEAHIGSGFRPGLGDLVAAAPLVGRAVQHPEAALLHVHSIV